VHNLCLGGTSRPFSTSDSRVVSEMLESSWSDFGTAVGMWIDCSANGGLLTRMGESGECQWCLLLRKLSFGVLWHGIGMEWNGD